MDNYQKLRVTREAGHIERGHNVPHHGTYSVGRHSYDVVCILMLLHPAPRMELIRAALWHDMPERFLGDLPAPAKWVNPKLNAEYQLAEQEVLKEFGEPELMSCLTEEETDWLHAADRLELLMWTDDQAFMGNCHTAHVRNNVLAWFHKTGDKIPQPIRDIVYGKTWNRNKETLR